MNKKSPSVSVIIPIFNCGSFLEQCLNSVSRQTFSDFEALLIYTPSEDKTLEIARRFCEKDKRFSILPGEGMAGGCRNVGIRHAKGEYLSFIDGDDSIRPQFLEKLIQAARKTSADIAVCGYCYFYENKQKLKMPLMKTHTRLLTQEQALKELLRDHTMRFYLWNKLWKRSLFLDNEIEIPDMYYEDAVACTRLFSAARLVISLRYCGYEYRRAFSRFREATMTGQRINDYVNTVPLMRLTLEERGLYAAVKPSFQPHVLHVLLSAPLLTAQASEDLQKGMWENTLTAMKKVVSCCVMSKKTLQSYDIQKTKVE